MDPLDWSIANLGKKLKNQLAGLALQPKLVIDEPCRCIREAEFGVWNKKSFLTAFANKADNYQYIIEIELVEKKEKRKSLNDELGKFSKNVSTYVDVIVLDTSRNIGFSGVPFKTKVLLQSTTVSFIGGFAFLTMADVEMSEEEKVEVSSSDYVEEESVSGKKKVMNLY
ncbi:19355_t:CDS:2 [Entrophospora sp. SA101]|nr:19355_t:CDS:2 [Entrophospora sp. SA101]